MFESFDTIRPPADIECGTNVNSLPSFLCLDTQNQSVTMRSTAPPWSATAAAFLLANSTISIFRSLFLSMLSSFINLSSQLTLPYCRDPILKVFAWR